MTSSQPKRYVRRHLVMRDTPVRLSEFVDEYRQELRCSREEAAFASADIFRPLMAGHTVLSVETCRVANVLDHEAHRDTGGLQAVRLIRYFELQALSKSKREPFILVEDDSGIELPVSDAAIYFSPSLLTRLIEEHLGPQTPHFICNGDFYKKQGGDAPATEKEQLRLREIHTVQRLTGALVAMVAAAARQDEACRVILNSKICEKDSAGKGPYAIAESLAFIADRLGISDFPDTDTVARYLPLKRKGA
ncbi:hypothetical protein PKB_5452 [Pseudomonas knackmussii B13]|uniref:Uncharacterized protein n=1 Tax=Pseudomonas knackmussii (strain DSM 6978 / CCUG 54928 / LMG 23759 / B13) TaxID=1301098 RepID=A0A024HQB6_PSEKB|nr:hypothetical protein [Pseudomonas knackmussii]CDF86762.1 hypothetical protein PKB_5452 [Pseudomonas knackmussii B13]